MKYYLYCSSGTLLEYFTLNKIVCNDYLSMKNRKVISSLGLINSKFLFLTAKKLCAEKRSWGFQDDYTEIPTVVEVTVSDRDASAFPVLAVRCDGTVSDSFSSVSDIPHNSLGFFVKAEISSSFVSKILFENENAKDDIYRPSDDLYFPEHLYGIVDEEFSEDIDTELLLKANRQIADRYSALNVSDIILRRTKVTAITMNTVFETRKWPFGKNYYGNCDSVTMSALDRSGELNNLKDRDGKAVKPKKDAVLYIIQKGNRSKSREALFFYEFIKSLIPLYSTNFSRPDFHTVADLTLTKVSDAFPEICDLRDLICDIENLVYGTSAISLETLIGKIPDNQSVIKALVFFLRSPNSGEKLNNGLLTYGAEADVCRYAWIMFSALNGIEPISAEKKGNGYIMKKSEEYALKCYPSEDTVSVVSSLGDNTDKFIPVIEEKLTAKTVRAYLLSAEYRRNIPVLVKKFSKNKKLSAMADIEKYELNYEVYAFMKNLVSKNAKHGAISRNEFEKISKYLDTLLKKPKFKFDSDKFFSDCIANKSKFDILYKADEKFWEEEYKRSQNQ